jgi:hypothetical protein
MTFYNKSRGMKYEERLIKELKNPDGYLWNEDSWIQSELDGMAKDMLHLNKGIESKIASLFIYHQLTEEILALLFRFCDLIVRGSLYPIKLNEPKPKRHRDFAKNLDMLKSSIEFEGKSRLISAAKELNKKRNRIGHRLVTEFKDFDIEEELKGVDDLFELIFKYRTEGLRWFYSQINRLKEREEINRLLDRY